MDIVLGVTFAAVEDVDQLVALEQYAEIQEGKAHSLNQEDSKNNR
jgi:hypothetical protein